ncbi:uncharacterized protein LOC103539530 isoform X2 [Calypte anna]|uniref:uncharacterized protein LOC103539530 isoform X2 n=1 Tax=Calypte anna TaxID=9244 RepID=UPI0011C43A42|nr:uncharacterized protein LOC103539530 isoform X2 [Calypte anna]
MLCTEASSPPKTLWQCSWEGEAPISTLTPQEPTSIPLKTHQEPLAPLGPSTHPGASPASSEPSSSDPERIGHGLAPQQPLENSPRPPAVLLSLVFSALQCIPAWPWPCWAQPCPAPLRVCARQYGGHLAAIHSSATNAVLWAQARLSNCGGKFWIGAVTKPWHRSMQCHWVDRTRWDFSNWQPGHPLCRARFCTSLCTADGHWRSQSCKQRLPFICEC